MLAGLGLAGGRGEKGHARLGWAVWEKEKREREDGQGQEEKKREREKKMHSNAFEFEFESSNGRQAMKQCNTT
jgi:hypothetical protein